MKPKAGKNKIAKTEKTESIVCAFSLSGKYSCAHAKAQLYFFYSSGSMDVLHAEP